MPFGGKTRTSGQGRQKGNLNKATREVKEIARPYGPGAIAVLAQLAGLIKGKPPAESEPARIMACRELLDRAYGKATVLIAGDEERGPIRYEFFWGPATPGGKGAPINQPYPLSDSPTVIDASAEAEPDDNGALTIEWTTEKE
jgi:hypothetical protein